MNVNEQSAAVKAMSANWPIIESLLGGTASMRQAGQKFLPKWPAENNESYIARKDMATLFPAMKRTLSVMAGKPFSKALTLADDVPKDMLPWLDDVDLHGRNLHTFASEMLHEALAYGFCGVLVEYTRVAEPAKTVEAAKKTGERPYLKAYKHSEILGWKLGGSTSVPKLTQLRLLESVTVEDGAYGEKTLQQVRVLELGRWEIHRQDKYGKWVLYESGVNLNMPDVAFVPFYGFRKGFMLGEPPLLDLAYLNVKHWQSQSDQDNIVRVARVPILVMAGAEDDAQLVVGASSAVKLPPGATLTYTEHSGAAIQAGVQALDALEKQMIQTGAELLVATPGNRTATEANNDAEANKCDLQRMVEGFEDSLDLCLQYMADWVNLGDGGSVSLFKDYGAATLSDASAQLVLSMQQGGLLSKDTALREMQRRGVLEANIDHKNELSQVESEGPNLGTAGLNGNGQ